jgi:outer membrane protein assembly factor BamA
LNPELQKYASALKALCLVILLFNGSNSLAQSENLVPGSGKRYFRIESIALTGNKITRDQIILREIIFNAGDYVRSDKLDSLLLRSRENLLNTSLFNFVDLKKTYNDPDSAGVTINVNVTERWYIWPTPILKLSDRNFNIWWETKDLSRISYGFYIDWRNFRGRKENLILRLQWGYNRVIVLQYQIPYLNNKKTLGMGFGFGYSRQKETAYQTVDNIQDFFREPEGFARQDYYAYGQFLVSANEVQYVSFSYQFKCDHRDFKSYPLKGYYFDLQIIKQGLWTFNNNTLNTVQFLATFRKFWELHPGVYFATGLNGKISAGLQPYFIIRGIGYDRDMVRSYEYYLVDARHFGILKNNVKFAIIPNHVGKLSFIRSDKFGKIFYALYLNVFFDAGYGVYDQDFGQETNDLQNTLLLGYGTGLDFVTYYDIVVRLEFSVNIMNEAGVFLHFMAPI